MYATSLTLPVGTPHIVVDPLEDFYNGEFVRCYGTEDTETIRETIDTLDAMVRDWQGKAELILCKSDYEEDLFGVEGLEQLCTTEEGRRSIIPEELFSNSVTKYHNSLFTASVDMKELIGDHEFFGVEGITLTSCVIKTIEDFRDEFKDRVIVVPMDAVGVRTSQEVRKLELIAELRKHTQVMVTRSYKDITHQGTKTTSTVVAV